MCVQRQAQRLPQSSVLLLCLLLLTLPGCATDTRTSGISGPVSWQATDLQSQGGGNGAQQSYTFLLRLRETQGTEMTLTKLQAILYNASDNPPAWWEQTGPWHLPANGEVNIPLASTRTCPYAGCRHPGPSLAPVWRLTLSGTDQQGRAVSLPIYIRLPYLANTVRTYQ